MQPDPTKRPAALQVDIEKVIELEAKLYTGQLAGLIRQVAVLSTALDDSEAANRELQAKVAALSGGGPNAQFNLASPFASGPFAGSSGRQVETPPVDEPNVEAVAAAG